MSSTFTCFPACCIWDVDSTSPVAFKFSFFEEFAMVKVIKPLHRLQHLLLSHKLYLYLKYLIRKKLQCRMHPPPTWNLNVARTVIYLKLQLVWLWGLMCRTEPAVCQPHPPKKYKIKKQATHSLFSSASAAPQPPRIKSAGAYESFASFLFFLWFSFSHVTPCSWRPRWERNGCSRRMGGACSLCSSSSTWARRDPEDTQPACSDTPGGERRREAQWSRDNSYRFHTRHTCC